MAYRVDDTFDTWPEVIRAGTAAIGLYVRCGAYMARTLTDGLVPLEVAQMYGTREWISKLCDVGLWEIEESGYRDVYYLVTKDGTKLNETRVEVLARRAAAAERTRKWREGKAPKGKKPQGSKPKSGDASRDAYVYVTGDVTDASRDASLSFPPLKGEGSARPASQGDAGVSPPRSPTEGQGQKPDLTALRGTLKAASVKARSKANGRAAAVTTGTREIPSLVALEAAIAELTDLPKET